MSYRHSGLFSTVRRRVVFAAAFAGLACAPPLAMPKSGVTRHLAPLPAPDESVIVDSAAVEVRGYPFSPHLDIISWTTEDADVGLRARLRRDGSVVRDHRVYVSTHSSVAAGSRFNLALASTRPLKLTGVSRDHRNCAGGQSCLPYETFGARIPDGLLRANPDSLPIKFFARDGHEVHVTLHRDLIRVYLASLDSVSSALRRR